MFGSGMCCRASANTRSSGSVNCFLITGSRRPRPSNRPECADRVGEGGSAWYGPQSQYQAWQDRVQERFSIRIGFEDGGSPCQREMYAIGRNCNDSPPTNSAE